MSQINYTLVRSRRLLSGASVSVSQEKGVVVRAPFWMTEAMIKGLVESKSHWIQKHLNKISSSKVVKKYKEGETYLYFGNEYVLSIKSVTTPGRAAVYVCDSKIEVEIYDGFSQEKHPEIIKEALLHWYLEEGIAVITEKVNYFSDQIGVSYSRISLKNVTSIWGSCSPRNCLSFNRKLVMAPHEVVDYVVIHEVSHMVHRNHGKKFWELVQKFDPLYKTHRRWLKQNHHLLSI